MPVALESVGILEGLPVGRELVEAYATLSFLCYSAADRAGARQWAARAHDLAVDLDDAAALARAEYAVGRVELEEDPEPGRERVLRARALAEQSGLEEIVAETYLTLGEIEDRSHVLPRARSRADRALPHRRPRGQRARAWPLDRGHDVSERRPRSARGLDVPRHARPHGARARPRAPRRPGRRAAAGAGARAGRSDGRARADHSGRRRERGSRWLRGDTAAARASTDAALDLAVRTESLDAVVELQAWRRRAGIDEPPMDTSGTGPYALEVAGDAAAAASSWSELGRPYEAALALADVASEEALRASLATLDSLGARAAASVVAHRLRRLGGRDVPRGPRRSTRSNAAGLTARELDVLRPRLRRASQRRDRRAAVPLAPHRRPPRLGDPAQARRALARRGGRRRRPSRTARRPVARRAT